MKKSKSLLVCSMLIFSSLSSVVANAETIFPNSVSTEANSTEQVEDINEVDNTEQIGDSNTIESSSKIESTDSQNTIESDEISDLYTSTPTDTDSTSLSSVETPEQQSMNETNMEEVIIDLSQPLDTTGASGYMTNGASGASIFIYDASKRYVIKNTPKTTGGNYLYVGGKSLTAATPGEFNITLENADLYSGQWNTAPLRVINPTTSLNLTLTGTNTISTRENWVNTRSLISVDTGTTLNIQGEGTLNMSTPVSTFSGAAIGNDSNDPGTCGTINIVSGTVNINLSNTRSLVGIGGTVAGTGAVTIGSAASVTVIGSPSNPAISAKTTNVSEGAFVRAYAKNNYAILTEESEGSAYLVNAYYAKDEVSDTFDTLSDSVLTPILCDTENVSVPAGYTSFAYDSVAGKHAHRYNNGITNEYLIQLNGKVRVDASTSLETVPLKKGITYQVNYYTEEVNPQNLIATMDGNGFITTDGIRVEEFATLGHSIGTIMTEELVSADTSVDWINRAKPAKGYENGVIANQDLSNLELTSEGYIINIVYLKKASVEAANVTVQYVDETGSAIHEEKIIKGNVEDSYDASTSAYKLTIEGYILDEARLPENAVGELSDTSQTVVYVYKREKNTKSEITVKDSTLFVGDSWTAVDNFVQAKSGTGEAIPFESITTEGVVDTKEEGVYKVTYSINADGSEITKVEKESVVEGVTDSSEFGKKDVDAETEVVSAIATITVKKKTANTTDTTNTTNETDTIKNNGKNNITEKSQFPKTGEQRSTITFIIGMFLLVLFAGVVTWKKTRKIKTLTK